jgi:hypothetical protein
MTRDDATRFADAPADFKLRFRLEEGTAGREAPKLALR